MEAQSSRQSVSTQFFTFGSAEDRFVCASGETLGELTLAYQTYGELNADKSNAILLFHALSGSQNAAGYNPEIDGVARLWTEESHIGWWDEFVGPRKALDTDHFFVICINYIGGCYGSTGPSSIDPGTGKPYGSAFPHISCSDIVNSQMRLIDHLGIDQLRAVVGTSVGGLLCLSLATLYPNRVRTVISVASALHISALQRLVCFEQVIAIENDQHFKSGDYYDGEHPDRGLALARMISHKTFIELNTLERRASRDIVQPDEQISWYRINNTLESYILHQGMKFVKRFDANTYLRILEMWLNFDPVADGGADGPIDLLKRCTGQNWLVFSIDSDVCFYAEQQAELVSVLKKAGVPCMHITVHSDKGHDSFLLEPELYTPHLTYALRA